MESSRSRPWVTTPLIDNFSQAISSEDLERLADDLGSTGDPAAIEILIYRLGDAKVQDDADVEDAVCGALTRLGVMEKLGNLNYRFLGEDELPEEAKRGLMQYSQLVPEKYRSR
jgi:hypothetical protein